MALGGSGSFGAAFGGGAGASGRGRRAVPLVISGLLHGALLLALAVRDARPVLLPSARPAIEGAPSVTLFVPVRIGGAVYGPSLDGGVSVPVRPSTDLSPRPSPAVAAGRSPARRQRPRGIAGSNGQAALQLIAAAAERPQPIAPPDPEPEPQPAPPPPIDTRPPLVAAPVTTQPFEQMPVALARGLRVFDTFPRLPQELVRAGRRYPVELEICVDQQGAVADVHVERGSPDQLNAALLSAVRTWRYRPYTVGGASRPFCHALRVVYSAG
jgi:TonB family protein